MNLARTQHKLTKGNHSQRSHLIKIDNRYSLMNPKFKKDVEHRLQSKYQKNIDELDYLLGKKQIDQMRKQKIKQLQDLYEKQRSSRIMKMDEKISRSSNNRSRNIKDKQSRSKVHLQYTQQKMQKIQKNNEKQLQKMLEAQRQYIKRNSESRSSINSINRSSSKNLKSSRSLHANGNHIKTQLQKSLQNIDSKIEQIQSRIDKAKTNQYFYQLQKSQKAKTYSKDIKQTLQKINTNTTQHQAMTISNYYSRISHIVNCQQKTKQFYQRQSQRRRTYINEKFKKCGENLQYLNKERQQKMDKLQTKLNRSILPKTWRDERSERYLQKFVQNHEKLERQKLSKAENILNKHLNLSMRNRSLKQKKDKILQSVKGLQI